MIIDIAFLILIIIACMKGYRKGFVMAMFSFAALIIALAAALKLSAYTANHLEDSLHIPAKWLPFISFIIVFFLAVLLVKWIGKLIEKAMETVLLGWINRLAGIILYLFLYTIIFSIFLFYTEKIHLFRDSTINSSMCYPFVKPWGPKVIDWIGELIPLFKGMFVQLEKFFANVPGKSV